MCMAWWPTNGQNIEPSKWQDVCNLQHVINNNNAFSFSNRRYTWMFSSHLNIFMIPFKANCTLSPFLCYTCHRSRVHNNSIQHHYHHRLHQSLGLVVQKSLQNKIKALSSSLAISCQSVTIHSIDLSKAKFIFLTLPFVAGRWYLVHGCFLLMISSRQSQ